MAGEHVELGEQLVVGRLEGDLVIADPRMSRRHACFRVDSEGGLELEDLGSSNGTWVNGERVTSRARLEPGDLVQIGATAIEVELMPAAAASAGPLQPVTARLEGDVADAPAATDELRPATALFADVVGSTAIGERLAPEEVKALIGECVSRMAAAVEQYGGVVNAFMGDGIAAFFGLPLAHEDDAERAARAGLHILRVVGEYANDIETAWGIRDFNVRVGINSGQVAVGVVGAGTPHQVALGDTANVAARIQSTAEPGSIAVGPMTAERLSGHFVLHPLGELPVKGRSEPVSVWRLVGRRREPEEPPPTPLVGRAAELERLQQARDDLLAGRGGILLLLGDAGLGKSRLLGELRTVVGGDVVWLEGTCVSYGKEFPLLPVVEALRRWLGLEDGDASLAVRTRLRIKLEPLLGPDLRDILPHLESLLLGGLRLEPSPGGDLVQAIARACCSWLEALARSGPVALALEDLQWADPWTCAFVEELLDTVERASILLATSLRFSPDSDGWRVRVKILADHPHRALELRLEPLLQADAERLLTLLQPDGLADQVRAEIIARGEGNPLYIEQLLQTAVEGGQLVPGPPGPAGGATKLVPPSLVNLLLARLDNLPPSARELAQTGAVCGRSFSFGMLTRMYPRSDLEQVVTVLVRAGVIREVRRYPDLEYAFSHGLLRDAALLTLTRQRRRELYGRVAAACESLFADTLDERLDLLAHYYGRSDDLPKALYYLRRAAAKATELAAGFQAAELLKRARAVAAELGDTEAEQEIAGELRQYGVSQG